MPPAVGSSAAATAAVTPASTLSAGAAGGGAAGASGYGLSSPMATGGPTVAPFRMQKRLDFAPAAACLYPRAPPAASWPGASSDADVAGHNLLLASHTGQLFVYREDTLLWAARLPFVPVAVAVGRFAGTPGLVTLLSSRGDVAVCYMGTDPPTGSITGGETVRDLDYSAMDAEHRRLLAVIRDAAAAEAGGGDAKDRVALRVTVPVALDGPAGIGGGGFDDYHEDEEYEDGAAAAAATLAGGAGGGGGGGGDAADGSGLGGAMASTQASAARTLSVKLAVAFGGGGTLRDVQVSIAPPPWALLPRRLRSVRIGELRGGGTPLVLSLPFRASRHGLPADTAVRVVAAYTLAGGEPRTSVLEFALPLALAVTAIPPVKTAAFKLTLDTNRPPPPLTALFPDLLTQQPAAVLPAETLARINATASNVLSFGYAAGGDVTILVSKAGGRYRLQAGSLEALHLVAAALTERLARYFAALAAAERSEAKAADEAAAGGGSGGEPPFAVAYNEPLPLADYFGAVDAHWRLRVELASAYSGLNDRAHEYRLVTKRLLVRFKDRTPAPLNNLDALLAAAHGRVMAAGSEVARLQAALAAASNRLSCATQLLLLLVRLRFGLDATSGDVLRAHLSPSVSDSLEQGWEERTDAALTHLLRVLASGGSGGSGGGGGGAAGSAAGSAAAAAAAAAAISAAQGLALPEDTGKLKKHITLLLDRLQKGAVLAPPAAAAAAGGVGAAGVNSPTKAGPAAAAGGAGSSGGAAGGARA
jgi:Bardet-Biedl syndrome 9 protein